MPLPKKPSVKKTKGTRGSKKAPKTLKTACDRPLLAINGFREDVAVLVSRYLANNSFRLEDFVAVWEEMQFGYVFGGTQTARAETAELNEFADKCFREAVMLCLPPYEPRNRVAGFYLLYCLYTSRPFSCHIRVRVHPVTEFLPMAEFVQTLYSSMHFDTVSTFLELYQQQAFRFAMTPLEMGWHTQRSRSWRDDAVSIHTYIPEIPAFLKNAVFTDVTAEDSAYRMAKTELLEQAGPVLDREQLAMLPDGFAGRLQDITDGYQRRMQDLQDGKFPETWMTSEKNILGNNEEGPSTDIDSIGERRQRIRQEQMAKPVDVQKKKKNSALARVLEHDKT